MESGKDRTEEAVARLSGKVVAAGESSRRAVSLLLGLDGTHSVATVTAVAWVDQTLQAAVDFGKDQLVIFTFARRSEDTQGLVLTEHLAVTHGRVGPGRVYSERLRRIAPKLFGNVTLEALATLISQDPETGGPGLAMPVDDTAGDHPRSLLDTWGESDAYADFFAVGEVARGQLDSLSPTNFFLFVQHSDSECQCVHPRGVAPLISLVNFPWEDRVRSDREPQAPIVTRTDSFDVMVTSELNEDDVIMGNQDKLRRLFQTATRIAEEKGRTLFFANTCVPIVTGEDVQSEFKRCTADCSCDSLYLTVDPRSMVNVFHEPLVKRRIEYEASVKSKPRTINIIGLAPSRGAEELRDLLSAMGIAVNVLLIPDLSYELIDALPLASLNVFVPNDTRQHLYDQMVVDTRIPHIEPPAPYGVEGTRRWIGEIARAVGVESDLGGATAHLKDPWRERWKSAKQRASRHRLGLVVRGEEVYHLTLPGCTWGVPIVAVLEEMGFGLDILLKLQNREQARDVSQEIHRLFANPERHSIKGFNSLDMMLSRLGESPCEAVMTYHSFDWRVSQAGKNAFSLQHFEVGMQGAVRTAERLIGICETPFYRQYARFLGRTPEGLPSRREK